MSKNDYIGKKITSIKRHYHKNISPKIVHTIDINFSNGYKIRMIAERDFCFKL